MASFSNAAFDTNAFSVAAFDFGTPATRRIDTHDGFDENRKEHDAKREARVRLREQIRVALEGPQAETARKALTPYSVKSESVPFLDTVDLDRVEKRLGKMKALQRILKDLEVTEFTANAMRAIEDDDEDIFFLL